MDLHTLPFFADNASTVFQVSLLSRLVVAVILGSVMGLERSIAGKHAGMRTYALASLGAALFVLVGTLASFQLGAFYPGLNPMQIASSIVVGIGFIGAGLVGFQREHPNEITTASGIWVSAAIGMACGYGFFVIAVATTLLGILILSLLFPFEDVVRKRFGKQPGV